MQIVFLDAGTIDLNGDVDYQPLQELGRLITYRSTPHVHEAISRCREAEYVITNKVPMTRQVVQACRKLRHIAVIATGYNNIDLAACRDHGIGVSNVPGYARHSVPQHVFALILNLATRTHDYHRDVMQGAWQQAEVFTLLKYHTFELSGKTIGIIGFGDIGRGVARIAKAFGMHVLMYRRFGQPLDGFECTPLDRIYREADILSVNCPLTDDNRYMINADVLRQMKPSALLINTARGPLVDQAALADALHDGVIAGAGIDVLDEEPPTGNPLLHDVPNLIITPHSAWTTIEARQRLIQEVAENIRCAFAGEPRNLIQNS
ncbi:MAG: D-2-hydroxyacid dehydrogenase [Saprospiraceae bacterium]|nr:D-2-hydroxyacid dehydrogenase [Saprospiraceae bacterium]